MMTCYDKQKEKMLTFPIFDNELLSASKRLKIGPKYCVFPIKHEEMCDVDPQCLCLVG